MNNHTTGLGNNTPPKRALRYNKDKPMLGLIDAEFELELGKVLTAGAIKYAKENWRKGLPWTEVVDSMKRHINAFMRGEDIDPETDCHHMAHAACNAMFLVWYSKYKKEFDNRYKNNKEEICEMHIQPDNQSPK